MYAKWFTLADKTCSKAVGCPLQAMEGPQGEDLGNSGAYTFNLALNLNATISASWKLAMAGMKHDATANSDYFIDNDLGIYWTWMDSKSIEPAAKKAIAKIGGLMTWSVGQDDETYSHYKALQAAL